eukprot:UC4_evm8s575
MEPAMIGMAVALSFLGILCIIATYFIMRYLANIRKERREAMPPNNDFLDFESKMHDDIPYGYKKRDRQSLDHAELAWDHEGGVGAEESVNAMEEFTMYDSNAINSELKQYGSDSPKNSSTKILLTIKVRQRSSKDSLDPVPEARICELPKMPSFPGLGLVLAGNRPVRVQEIETGSPSEAAGLQAGDEIMEVMGLPCHECQHHEVVRLIDASVRRIQSDSSPEAENSPEMVQSGRSAAHFAAKREARRKARLAKRGSIENLRSLVKDADETDPEDIHIYLDGINNASESSDKNSMHSLASKHRDRAAALMKEGKYAEAGRLLDRAIKMVELDTKHQAKRFVRPDDVTIEMPFGSVPQAVKESTQYDNSVLDQSMKSMKAHADGELRRGDPLFNSQEFMDDFSNPLFTDAYVPIKHLVRQPSVREAVKIGKVVQLDATSSSQPIGPQGTTFKPITDPKNFNGIMTGNSQQSCHVRTCLKNDDDLPVVILEHR